MCPSIRIVISVIRLRRSGFRSTLTDQQACCPGGSLGIHSYSWRPGWRESCFHAGRRNCASIWVRVRPSRRHECFAFYRSSVCYRSSVLSCSSARCFRSCLCRGCLFPSLKLSCSQGTCPVPVPCSSFLRYGSSPGPCGYCFSGACRAFSSSERNRPCEGPPASDIYGQLESASVARVDA